MRWDGMRSNGMRSNEMRWDGMMGTRNVIRSMIDRPITLRTADDDDLLVVFIDEPPIR